MLWRDPTYCEPAFTPVSLSPSSQEGADSCMILQAAQHNRHKILIRTVDTDVVVLAVSMAQDLGPEDEFRLAFGAGKNLPIK